jgi:hypothetical protein
MAWGIRIVAPIAFRARCSGRTAAAGRRGRPTVAPDGARISTRSHFNVARHFFNVHDERSAPDTVGEELPDAEAAWKEATLIPGELFKDVDGKFRPGQEWLLEVTDERRNPLHFIRVSAEEI